MDAAADDIEPEQAQAVRNRALLQPGAERPLPQPAARRVWTAGERGALVFHRLAPTRAELQALVEQIGEACEECDGPWPLVVDIHWGPWSGRYEYGPIAAGQQAAERGTPGGTRGYGWDVMSSARYLGPMLDDVVDGIRWAVAGPARIAVTGASHGGDAALALATGEEPLVRCAVAAGPTATSPRGAAGSTWRPSDRRRGRRSARRRRTPIACAARC